MSCAEKAVADPLTCRLLDLKRLACMRLACVPSPSNAAQVLFEFGLPAKHRFDAIFGIFGIFASQSPQLLKHNVDPGLIPTKRGNPLVNQPGVY